MSDTISHPSWREFNEAKNQLQTTILDLAAAQERIKELEAALLQVDKDISLMLDTTVEDRGIVRSDLVSLRRYIRSQQS